MHNYNNKINTHMKQFKLLHVALYAKGHYALRYMDMTELGITEFPKPSIPALFIPKHNQ